jgi:two-component system, LytTR family, response regulator
MSELRVVVAEDEDIARAGLVAMLRALPAVQVVAQVADGAEAVRAIREQRPDVALLDIRMPRLSGIQVVEALDATGLPHIVFITAFDEFAVRGFELAALDYLVKPFTEERLAEAIGRARKAQQQRVSLQLLIREGESTHIVGVASILRIESADYYARVVTAERSYLTRQSMTALAAKLAPHGFIRLNRSLITRRHSLRELRKAASGTEVVLTDGSVHRVARGQRRAIEEALTRSPDHSNKHAK